MITRSFNTQLIRGVFSHPELIKRVSEGYPVEVHDPDKYRQLYYLVAHKKNEVLGVVIFHKQSNICYQGHVNYLPMYWKDSLHKYTKEAINWMFNNAGCEKIIGYCPDYYPEIKLHARRAGMEQEGYVTNSVKINNELYGESIMGISK